ncbi:RDD family protein [Streptomyces koelreuteriae]|uniref:RDD family protein n=1 Tax=Streptomyces koelreuteriae TaxID=2838015 RepID=UPI003EB7359D
MSAPTPAPGDDRPREGFYPDPSIPGYVRYWNGASWVPGTSRPAPKEGETLAPPPGAGSGSAASVEETGPHFFDEDPAEGPVQEPSAADAQHGSRPEPATAWGADRSRQSGFGGDQDRRVSWGAPQGAQGAAAAQGSDPRVPHADPGPQADQGPDGASGAQEADAASAGGGTFVFRRPTAKSQGGAAAAAEAPDEGTMTFRAVSPRQGTGSPASGSGAPGGPAASGGNAGAGGFGAAGSGSAGPAFGGQPGSAGPGGNPSGPAFGAQPGAAGAGAAGPGANPAGPGFGAGKAAAARAAAAQAGAGAVGAQASAAAPTALSGPQASPTVPPQSGGPQPGGTPLSAGPGGGQSSWAQQVHRLAGTGDEQPVAPWKPPTEDVFQAAARRQAAARPAGLGKRLAARLLDTVVLLGVSAAAAVPLGTMAIDHVNEKIDAAKLSGETVTVWLLDGTTSVYLGIVLAVLLLVGVVSEVLPTAKWGRTLGKKLMGLEVRDIEGHEAPDFGSALRRWLVYSVPGLLVVGIVGVAWCLFDKPWRQCWHDKAAHTFVAG